MPMIDTLWAVAAVAVFVAFLPTLVAYALGLALMPVALLVTVARAVARLADRLGL